MFRITYRNALICNEHENNRTNMTQDCDSNLEQPLGSYVQLLLGCEMTMFRIVQLFLSLITHWRSTCLPLLNVQASRH